MITSLILKNAKTLRIDKKPVVVLPLDIWKEIEERLEDFEMMASRALRKKIAKARSEKKLYSSSRIKEILGI